jgi:hypothetical protein
MKGRASSSPGPFVLAAHRPTCQGSVPAIVTYVPSKPSKVAMYVKLSGSGRELVLGLRRRDVPAQRKGRGLGPPALVV